MIIDIVSLALRKTNVLDPLSSGAEAFELLRARLDDSISLVILRPPLRHSCAPPPRGLP